MTARDGGRPSQAGEMPENLYKFSIGAMSHASGIPVETLRTWERRYGFPSAQRTPSGHRRYSAATVERLRTIKLALDNGHRPSDVVSLSEPELARLLGFSGLRTPAPKPPEAPAVAPAPRALPPSVEAWLGLVETGRFEELDLAFRRDWLALSAEAFIATRASPFLWEIGDRWAIGRLSVMQEHAASQRLRDFLSEQWRPFSDRNMGPRVVCSTLPGELHDIGVHMAAAVLAVHGARVVFLGADTPVVETARAVTLVGAAGVALSISVATQPSRATDRLVELRGLVPAQVPIIVGGAGIGAVPEGVLYAGEIGHLASWYAALASPQASPSPEA